MSWGFTGFLKYLSQSDIFSCKFSPVSDELIMRICRVHRVHMTCLCVILCLCFRISLAKWWEFGSPFRCSSPLASSTPWQTCSSCQQDCFQVSSFANVCKMGKITSQVKCLMSLAVLQRMLFLYVFVRCTTELGRYFGEELDPCDHWQCHRRSLRSLSFNQRHSDVEMRPHLL